MTTSMNEWKDWEDTFADEVCALWGTASPVDATTAFDTLDFDAFFLPTTDDQAFAIDPFASTTSTGASLAPTLSFNDLLAIGAAPVPDMHMDNDVLGGLTDDASESQTSEEEEDDNKKQLAKLELQKARSGRKRKATDVKVEPKPAMGTSKKRKLETAAAMEQAERTYRKRFDILHEILEAWNTGGIEDMEEIAPEVYHDHIVMLSPDYQDGLCGVQAIMEHWNLLLDAFPDGIMEEYDIERQDPAGNQINVSWVFSGTQIFPFFGVQPRHEKVTIRGTSLFTFDGNKISRMVLQWNYREALMKLMGLDLSTEQAR